MTPGTETPRPTTRSPTQGSATDDVDEAPDERGDRGRPPVGDPATTPGENPAAEPDQGHDDPVDPDVGGEHLDGLVRRPDDDRRPARAGLRTGGALLVDRAERHELGDERGDRAAVEPHPGGELGAGQRT